MGPALSLWERVLRASAEARGLAGVNARRWRGGSQHNQRLVTFTRRPIPGVETAAIMAAPRRGERARWPATDCGGGGRSSGGGPRGILGRSGDLVAGQTRPPSAWLRAKGCVLAWSGSSSSTVGTFRKRRARVPVRPEQGHLTGRWRITAARSVRASSKRYLQTHNPDERPALRSPFHPFSERSREAGKARPLRWRMGRGRGGVNTASDAAHSRHLRSHPIPGPSPSRGRENFLEPATS